MDGYVAKPVDRQELARTLQTLAAPESQSAMAEAAHETRPEPSAGPSIAVYDHAAAVEYALGNEALLRELAGLFLGEAVGRLERLKQGVATGNPVAVQEAAHALKGAAGNFCARVASERAHAVEANAHRGVIDVAQVAELEHAIVQLTAALERLR
jgi:HPt (histidine-containing phosphotransfer) domain-containing protein